MKLDREGLLAALTARLPGSVAKHLVDEFVTLRQEVATGRVGGSSPGKFVEAVVQALQVMERGSFDPKPHVDQYLRDLESRETLDDGLRICASRIARSMYALRNKRSIAHLGDVDANRVDLAYLLHAAQWILSEFVRVIGGVPMELAGRIVSEINAPVAGLVDDLSGRKIVVANLTAREEILVLLHSEHPDALGIGALYSAMDRRDRSTVRKAVQGLWRERLVEGNGELGYRLTSRGHTLANEIIAREIADPVGQS